MQFSTKLNFWKRIDIEIANVKKIILIIFIFIILKISLISIKYSVSHWSKATVIWLHKTNPWEQKKYIKKIYI